MNRRKLRVAVVAASLDILGGQGVQARSLVDGAARRRLRRDVRADQPAVSARARLGAATSVVSAR